MVYVEELLAQSQSQSQRYRRLVHHRCAHELHIPHCLQSEICAGFREGRQQQHSLDGQRYQKIEWKHRSSTRCLGHHFQSQSKRKRRKTVPLCFASMKKKVYDQ